LFVSRIGYDPAVTRAQIRGVDPVTFGGCAADEIRSLWATVRVALLPSPEEKVIGT
jgi:hypothetical protein